MQLNIRTLPESEQAFYGGYIPNFGKLRKGNSPIFIEVDNDKMPILKDGTAIYHVPQSFTLCPPPAKGTQAEVKPPKPKRIRSKAPVKRVVQITEEEKSIIRDLHKAGYSPVSIVRNLDGLRRKEAIVTFIARYLTRRVTAQLSPLHIEKIREQLMAGEKPKCIAAKLGLNLDLVNFWVEGEVNRLNALGIKENGLTHSQRLIIQNMKAKGETPSRICLKIVANRIDIHNYIEMLTL